MTGPLRMGRTTGLRWLERACAAAGVVALLICVAALAIMRSAAAASRQAVLPAPTAHSPEPAGSRAPRFHIVGRVEIPELHLQAPMSDGVDKLELIAGVGHIPGSAVPGGLGTMALAGHRDTFFRSLERVSRGMQVRVSDGSNTYVYQVDGTRIVRPDQVEVLNTGDQPSLVLITCYPFHYIGASPRRFVVHARLLSLLPLAVRE